MHDLCCMTRTSYTTTCIQYKYQNRPRFPQFYHNNPAIFDKIGNIPHNLWHFTSQLFPRYFRNVSASFWRDSYMYYSWKGLCSGHGNSVVIGELSLYPQSLLAKLTVRECCCQESFHMDRYKGRPQFSLYLTKLCKLCRLLETPWAPLPPLPLAIHVWWSQCDTNHVHSRLSGGRSGWL